MGRREFLIGGASFAMVPQVRLPRITPTQATALELLAPSIRPRDEWGSDLAPVGPFELEEDVRFLLVHHTVNSNTYEAEDVAGLIQQMFEFHTSSEKGWSDVAYNFYVDRFGRIWEARAGSIEQPIRGDATGGSQGFGILSAFIGNHEEAPPSDEAVASMVSLLAWLGERYGVDTSVGQTVSFTSRGSSLWPEGDAVTVASIAAHRDLSATLCPGQFGAALVADDLPGLVTARRDAAHAAVEEAATSTTAPTTTSTTQAVSTSTTSLPVGTAPSAEAGEAASSSGGSGLGIALPVAVLGGGIFGLAAWWTSKMGSKPDLPST